MPKALPWEGPFFSQCGKESVCTRWLVVLWYWRKMVQIRMFLEGGEKEGLAYGSCQPKQDSTHWGFLLAFKEKEFLFFNMRLETTRLGLCPSIFLFISPGGTRGLIFSAFVFNFFEVLIVEFHIYTTLTFGGCPGRISKGYPVRTLLSQISGKQRWLGCLRVRWKWLSRDWYLSCTRRS